METKGFFLTWNHHKCLSYLFLIHLNTYVMGLRPLEICLLLHCWYRLQTSESDVYRRQTKVRIVLTCYYVYWFQWHALTVQCSAMRLHHTKTMWRTPQKTWDVGSTLVYRWANVVDGWPTVSQRYINVSSLLFDQRRRRWANSKPTLAQRITFARAISNNSHYSH